MKVSDVVHKDNCCGCGICTVVCPNTAIIMKEDEYGFLYPHVDAKKCINCGLCCKNCASLNVQKNASASFYAGVNVDKKMLHKSASGGIFSAIASSFLAENGVVCGSTLEIDNGNMNVRHILISEINELYKLQGSKYVQSTLWPIVPEIKEALLKGKKVLFSGTPCQVNGMLTLFKKYHGTQLFTIDLICHGVPNQKIFNAYGSQLQDRYFQLNDYCFRDKKNGWGEIGTAYCIDGQEIKVSPYNDSYYYFFARGEIFRESCYSCPYASSERVGDVTVGDYWGVQTFDADLLKVNGGPFTVETGLSCFSINTEAGRKLIDKYGEKIEYREIDRSHVIKGNSQLNGPVDKSPRRKKILQKFKDKGYEGVEILYKRHVMAVRCKKIVRSAIPSFVINFLKSNKK